MPHFHKYEWEDFIIKAEPTGIRKLSHLLPYLTGGTPTFKLTIQTVSGEPRPLEMHIQLFDPTGKKESWKKLSMPNEPIKNIKRALATHPISVSGDHYLQMHLVWHKSGHPESIFLDIITFKAIAQEIMLAWVIGTVLGVSVLVVGILNLIYRL